MSRFQTSNELTLTECLAVEDFYDLVLKVARYYGDAKSKSADESLRIDSEDIEDV